tara:strand:+ start:2131 stop:2625 length:495 start_codon:yes stop_codon:yes gene_type:complete
LKRNTRIFRFGDNISTDVHLSSKYRPIGTSLEELKSSAFGELDSKFSTLVQDGDFLVAGKNFGLVSSRQDSAIVLKELGISCVLAKSFGHMFYRNALNSGLPLVICDTDKILDKDSIEVNFEEGLVKFRNKVLNFPPYPESIMKMIKAGGLIPFIKENRGYYSN